MNEKSNYTKNHFALNRWILKYAGLWAPESNSKCIVYLYKTYAIFVYLVVNIYFTTTEFISIKDLGNDLELLIKNVNFALTHLMGFFKCSFWFLYKNKIIHIIKTLEDEKFQYESTSEFNPGQISVEAKRTGIIYTFSFFLMAHSVLSSAYIPNILAATFYPTYIEGTNGTTTFYQRLPYICWMPFQYNTPKLYILAVLYQAGPGFSYAYSIVGMDTLFMNIMNYIASHLLILKGAFKTVQERSVIKTKNVSKHKLSALQNAPELEFAMKMELRKCNQHLQTVINMCEELENAHNYLTLGQILATLFILCTSLYLVSSAPIASKQFASEVLYMIAMGFQLTLYCWFGSRVTERALEIPDALWEGGWLESSKSFKTSMMITMARMRKPVYLTVGKFAPLTLATYVAILKASYSFFAVLKKAND